ncbi:penicillin synthase (plasmid) [Paraburkholderia caffeinilytica]|uniref:2-oxoglutarate-dependent ethylene/succinate-forming enzyme n=2 Tax=Paraburkholderia TaxID=1822464 RepID=A0A6J5FKP9_9BURK|nr:MULTISPECIES: 2-oxoglutarate and iron-dependent oxygenase domain-containing protein [Paraburkholderia]AXL53955.1 penicillin synthase [Paraburkholderia caffeinilytica]GGC64978.1 oxidoreductase [Paraburkholderia caffeinilytica]CAB3781961.1 Validamycin A dioxygenase [Paraburkholderia caffeinitolerans]CAB3802536.1 Validamycin A dioxygenase [Paraburkholderia caffeinilytica]
MLTYTPPTAAKFIPVIDLEESFSADLEARKKVAWEVHKACRDTGFFYVSNHRMSESMTEGQLALARAFFALPLEEKLKININNNPTMRGYEPMSSQALDDGSMPDLKEGFLAGINGLQAYVTKGEYNSQNQWPDAVPSMAPTTDAYLLGMLALGRHLMSVLALSLELPEDYFSEGLDMPMITTRLLHYPPQPRVGQGNQLGAGAHTDWGMLTMLLQDEVGGLEVRNADGEWVRAPHIPGTFIINLGDMVPVLTNGLYHSTMHRVLNSTPDRHRYSVPTFFDPNYFFRIKPLASCGAPQGGPAREYTVGEHIAEMYAKTYGGKVA